MVSTTLANVASNTASTAPINHRYQPHGSQQTQSVQNFHFSTTISNDTKNLSTTTASAHKNLEFASNEYPSDSSELNNICRNNKTNNKILESPPSTDESLTINSNISNNKNDRQQQNQSPAIFSSTSSILNDQISLLFPKCRPKSDTLSSNSIQNNEMQHNQNNKTTTTINSSPPPLSSSSLSSESLSSVAARVSTNPFLNTNLNHERYHLTPSSSTSIAPYYQQQQTTSTSSIPSCYYNRSTLSPQNVKEPQTNTNTRQINTSMHSDMYKKRNEYYTTNQNPFIKNNYWEIEQNSAPLKTVLNSPELTENEILNNMIQKQQHIKVGKSPVSHSSIKDFNTKSSELNNTRSRDLLDRGIAVANDGEVVVFDDISENWQNLLIAEDVPKTKISSNMDRDNISYEYNNYQLSDKNLNINTNNTRHNIIEYEGSPRKIGHTHNEKENDYHIPIKQYQQQNQKYRKTTSPPMNIARPGFPQRILSPSQESLTTVQSCNQQQQQQQQQQKQHQQQINTNYKEISDKDLSEIGASSSSNCTTSENYHEPIKSATFDYLYEFSETRKVLEEFFKCPTTEEKITENESDIESIDIHYEFRDNYEKNQNHRIQHLSNSPSENYCCQNDDSPYQTNYISGIDNINQNDNHDIDFFLDSASRSSDEQIDNRDALNQNRTQQLRGFKYSPETTDYESNNGDVESVYGDFSVVPSLPNYSKHYAACMPVLEDGLSSGQASDTENNNPPTTGISILMDIKRTPTNMSDNKNLSSTGDIYSTVENSSGNFNIDEPCIESVAKNIKYEREISSHSPNNSSKVFKNIDPELDSLYSINVLHRSEPNELTPPPPAPAPHRKPNTPNDEIQNSMDITSLKELRLKNISSIGCEKPIQQISSSISIDKNSMSPIPGSPIWVPRNCENNLKTPLISDNDQNSKNNLSADEEEVDTDLETDRLLGHQKLDDKEFYDDNKIPNWDRKPRSLLATSLSKFSPKVQQTKSIGSSLLRHGLNSLLPTTLEASSPSKPQPSSKLSPPSSNQHQQQQMQQQSQSLNLTKNTNNNNNNNNNNKLLDLNESESSPDHSEKSPEKSLEAQTESSVCNVDSPGSSNKSNNKKDSEKKNKKSKNKEGNQPVLIEGVLFRARYLGSTQLVCEGQPTKSTRMMQAEEAVSRIKAPDGEVQPSTEVDLFISTEKIMVLNTDLKEIMMDHALRTISYIADIGDLVVLMARRRFVPQDIDDGPKPNRTPKMICHVFESDEAQFIAQSIGQAFQVAYMEFLKANGIEDHSFVKEMDYQEVLNSQEIFGDELEIFAKKELQKEVVVPKAKGEILGVVIVESGWGSMLPTVVIANLMSSGAAARCGQLNIGDQLIAINGLSLVGLPLSTCQNYIKNTKNQTVVKFTVVPCPPVVEVKIKRPNTKYQLGFSVQNGVICSLLRGGIAERGGVRVGHRIIEINNQSVVAVPHEKIVNLLATSVGEILMKTMPTSMFRLLTGQENPIFI